MKKRLAILAIISVLWGSEWLLDALVNNIPRFRLLALRCLVAGVALIPFVSVRRKIGSGLLILKSMLLGIFVIVLPIFFLANRTDLSPGMVVVCFAMLPLMVSIVESGGGLRNVPALSGGLGGTAFLVRGGLSFSLTQTISVLILVSLLTLVSIALVQAKRRLSIAALPQSVMIQMFTAAAIFGVNSLLCEHGLPSDWTLPLIGVVVLLGIFGGAAAYGAFYWLLLSGNPTQAVTIQWLVPAVGVIESAILLRHLPSWDSVLGGIVSIGCTIAMLRSPLQEEAPLTLQITASPQHQNASLHSGEG